MECLHEFHSVIIITDWTVECKNCNKDIFDIYSKEDANKVIDSLTEDHK